ncbi:MAG: PepSY-like domain-containing protein [Phaeodactylibacter sp.]|nr:PepSY-like domain-containing protein [Phaeodactylibacter sp.]
MERFALLAALAVFSSTLYAQDDVPPTVKEAFAARFAGAGFAEWEDPEDGVYEVDFELDGKDMMAKFDANGNWVETETEITETDLPEAVWQAITSQYAGYKIDKVETEATPERPLAYKIKLEQDDKKVKVTFSADGEVLKKKEG